MRLFHHSQDKNYRFPTGAVPTGTEVTLRLSAEGEFGRAYLRLIDGDSEQKIPMEQNGNICTATVSVGDTPRLLWYDFIIEAADGVYYYANNESKLGGIGSVSREFTANSYQITVYDKDFTTPEWFRGRIMYQIFPDRFYGVHGGEGIFRKRPEYAIHEDWYEPLAFQRHPHEDGPACNDFYGGNLAGIRAKLPYLKSLGVGVLYLNPIFDAYSDHKYDTADYKTIDPMFGTEEDFRDLCAAAEELDIRIILDGVFSHTGTDSVYFNKYGNYGEYVGAYRDGNSPYRPWYQFTDFPNYNSWWGCSNLPNVNETEPTYLDYILRSDDAVVKKWLRCGAFGWRLDVADELPDEFIRILREQTKAENPDAVVIGEVWEDASNKVAYSEQRKYLLGSELDSVMNYPFKDCVTAFLMGWISPEEMNRKILSQIENYPPQVLHSLMNMLGTHDTMRIKSLLGGLDENCGTRRLSSKEEELAIARLKIGVVMQMTFYGVPCIYYGDEAGMEGGRDPFNRGTYPWRHTDEELREWYRKLGGLRNRYDCFRRGAFLPVYAEGDVFAYLRCFEAGKDPFGKKGDGSFALCAVNRSLEPREIVLDKELCGKRRLTSFFDGKTVDFAKEQTLKLNPFGAEILLAEGEKA